VEILKEVFGRDLPKDLGRRVLGSIMECQVRGLLPTHDSFVYRDPENRGEIDYLLLPDLCVEFSVADKGLKQLHFDLLPDNSFRQVLLGHTRKGKWRQVIEIPYYEFLYGISVDRESYLEEIALTGDIPKLPDYDIASERDEPENIEGYDD
jgi:hypothetical protein